MSEPAVDRHAGHEHAAVDRAIDLLITNEPAESLRWSLAVLEREPGSALALFATSRALARLGSSRAALDGLRLSALRAAAAGDALLAVAALGDVQTLGTDGRPLADELADLLRRGDRRALDPSLRFALQAHVQPLAPVLGERALVARATQRVYESASFEGAPARPLDFLASLSHEATRDLILAFETATVPAGHHVLDEGETAHCGCFLVRGSAEIRRRGASTGEPQILAHLEPGAFFGELALLARLPSPSGVVTARGSLLVLAWHDAVDAVAAKHPDVRFELAAHCKRQAAANLGTALTLLDAVPLQERAPFVDRMDFRTFERGDRLAKLGEEPEGLHVVVSGGVLLVARDGAERTVLQTLLPGDTVGETELVFCRAASTEAIAIDHTATLFLPRSEFEALARDYPGILHGVYGAASRRNAETSGALDARAADVEDDFQVEDEPAESERTGPHVRALPVEPSPAPSAPAPPIEVFVANDVPSPLDATPTSVPPPLTRPVPSQPPVSSVAGTAVSVPAPRGTLSSIAPAAVSQKPPASPSASRGPFANRYVRTTALVAFAAGVCAVLAPRGDHGLASAPPSAGGEGPPAPRNELPSMVAGAPPAAPPALAALPAPSATPSAHAPATVAAPAKHRSETATPPARPSASVAPPPTAHATARLDPVPTPAPSTAPATHAAPAAPAADDFGGRE